MLVLVCAAVMSLSSSGSLSAGFWTPLNNPPPFATPIDPGLGSCNNPLLLTDGSILVQNVGFNVIIKLSSGNTFVYISLGNLGTSLLFLYMC